MDAVPPVTRIDESDGGPESPMLPLVSVVVPAFNEATIIAEALRQLCDYLPSLSDRYRWELLVIDDGSTDGTGEIAESFAARRPHVRVLHHGTNLNVGQAMRTGFNECAGEVVVTIESDLSYAPDHIGRLLDALHDDQVKVAVASPYMRGGRTTAVPLVRRLVSRSVNRFLSLTAGGELTALTGMVRGYDRTFVNRLDLRSTGPEINTEILYKAQFLGAGVVEIPAHLDWSLQREVLRRPSSRLGRSAIGYLLAGVVFRPVVFLLLPGVIVGTTGLTMSGLFVRRALHDRTRTGAVIGRPTTAIWSARRTDPPRCALAGVCILVATQLLAMGAVIERTRREFERLFHTGPDLDRAADGGPGVERDATSPIGRNRRH